MPEIPRGTGEAQKNAVTGLLDEWNIFHEVVGQVFDTTSSITGREIGACVLVEQHLDKAIAWLACRHHVYEVHMKHVVGAVTGDTKEPGVKQFKKLKDAWNSMDIDISNLVKFDWTNADDWHCEKAKDTLEWAMHHL